MSSKLLYSKLLNNWSTIQLCPIQLYTLPGIKLVHLCIVNNGIMNGGIVGTIPYRALYNYIPCQELFISSGLIYSIFLYGK